MNLAKLTFIGLSVVAIAATQACGGKDDTTAAATGGTTSAAGTTGNAGTNNGGSGNGSSGASNGGEDNSGGEDNNGGDGNDGGADNNGGAGNGDGGAAPGNSPSCPAEEPETGFGGDSCSEDNLECTFGDQICTCNVNNGGGFPGNDEDGGADGSWFCEDAPLECPAAAPTDGDDCEGEGGNDGCDYADTHCECNGFGNSQTWSCDAPLVCPATQPGNGDDCEGGGDSCPYGDTDCVCTGDNGWFCFGGFGGDGGLPF
ncbi:MAG TPA: hypothetical protein VHO25_24995 [Polyangiaceae bacterium]|nr:hypothetical protein [Polyangiaceae bacterium]